MTPKRMQSIVTKVNVLLFSECAFLHRHLRGDFFIVNFLPGVMYDPFICFKRAILNWSEWILLTR